MESVIPSRTLPPWFRAFALALLLVQGVLASMWVMEGVQGIGVRAHVEAQGGTTHHAHDEAECPSCVGRSIQASAPLVAHAILERRASHQVQVVLRTVAPSSGGRSIHASRAPPLPVAGPLL
jgi:hypothetical protein